MNGYHLLTVCHCTARRGDVFAVWIDKDSLFKSKKDRCLSITFSVAQRTIFSRLRERPSWLLGVVSESRKMSENTAFRKKFQRWTFRLFQRLWHLFLRLLLYSVFVWRKCWKNRWKQLLWLMLCVGHTGRLWLVLPSSYGQTTRFTSTLWTTGRLWWLLCDNILYRMCCLSRSAWA